MKLTDSIIKNLPAPATGNRITYDSEVTGFGARVTAAGARAFILNYRTNSGRERRYTIGAFPTWKTAAAREEAKRLKQEIRTNGADPVGGLESERAAPTVADLCARYIEEHLPKKRPGSQAEDRSLINQWILGGLRHAKVAEVTFTDVDALHRKISRAATPIRANRAVALLSKMMALAIKWGWRTDNPCRGIERNQEAPRKRYLSAAELARLTEALAIFEDQQAADIIRLLMLTGARRGEVLTATWEQFDLDEGVWTKPGATTKQKTEHRVPLSAPARQLLSRLRARSDEGEGYVFPSDRRDGKPRENVKGAWSRLCLNAKIRGRAHS